MEVAAENPESAILEFAYRDAIVQVAASVVQSDKRDPNRRSIELHVHVYTRTHTSTNTSKRERGFRECFENRANTTVINNNNFLVVTPLSIAMFKQVRSAENSTQ